MPLIPVTHTPGRHCSSTALSDLVNFQGIPWSEAFCFGIGRGLGIWYIDTGDTPPERLVHVRSADIEERFFRGMGQPFAWERFDDPAAGEAALINAIDRGAPALIQTDIYYLPHYDKSAHFPGHAVAVWGYDGARQVFVITDTERPDPVEVPFEDMRKARCYAMGFFDIRGNMYVPGRLDVPEDPGGAVMKAVAGNSRSLAGSADPRYGLPALRTWLDDLPAWEGLADWRWTARFASQVIEKRGTGGGGFRLMYADFLDEAAAFLPGIAAAGLPGLMRKAGLAWRELSLALRKLSESGEFGCDETRRALEEVLARESAYHAAVKGFSRS